VSTAPFDCDVASQQYRQQIDPPAFLAQPTDLTGCR
jgi:hypothetical protein